MLIVLLLKLTLRSPDFHFPDPLPVIRSPRFSIVPRLAILSLAADVLLSVAWGAPANPAAATAAPRQALDRPNVVVIFLDDAGYGDFEQNGNPTIRTPRIAKLAAEGASFTQFYVASAACSASRYALLTGRIPARSGLGSWTVGPESERHIHAREVTLADGLHQRGYATGMFGKWHLGTPNSKNGFDPAALPLAHGFDQWIGTNVSHDYPAAMLLQSDPAGREPIAGYRVLARNLPSNPAVCESLTGRYTAAAVDFIHAHRAQPFFAYVALNQPHLGLFCGKEFQGTSRRGLLGDVMAEADHCVGAIVNALAAEGLTGNTMIFFSSDNGPWIRYQDIAHDPKYGDTRLQVGYALPFRNGKGSDWEGGHRVPGIFYWPGVIPPARVLDPASTLDVLPTVFQFAGEPLPSDRTLDGRNIGSLLTPKLGTKTVPQFHLLYPGSNNQPLALREGPWKLVTGIQQQYRDDGGFKASLQKPLLFQLEQDLGERIDRGAEHPDIVDTMKKEFLDQVAQIRSEGTFWGAEDGKGHDSSDDEPAAPAKAAEGH